MGALGAYFVVTLIFLLFLGVVEMMLCFFTSASLTISSIGSNSSLAMASARCNLYHLIFFLVQKVDPSLLEVLSRASYS